MAFSTHDQVPDSPTNTFATLNPLVPDNGNISFDNGNLSLYPTNSGNYGYSWWTSMFLPTKTNQAFYFEFTGGNGPTLNNSNISIALLPESEVGTTSAAVPNSNKFYGENFYTTLDPSNVSGVLIDFVNSKVTIFSNNVEITAKSLNISIPNNVYSAALCFQTGTGGHLYHNLNFGQDPTFGGAKPPSSTYTDANGIGSFYYQPPTGALALCTANLPTPDIDPNVDDLPEDYMKAVTWTGTGGTRDIDFGWDADLVWVKNRDSGGANHFLVDSVLQNDVEVGGITPYLSSNATGTGSGINSSWRSSYGSMLRIPNGLRITSGSSSANSFNGSGVKHVAWIWKAAGAAADGGSSVAGSARIVNEDGTQADTTCDALASAASASITPSKVSANRKSGFSIVKYGVANAVSTVPHGLSKAPEMMIFKNLNQSYNWSVYHKSLPSAAYILTLNSSSAQLSSNPQFNSTAPTSSLFTVGTGGNTNYVNSTSDEIIAYCWHSVLGFSKFGSYVGTGSSTNKNYVYLGFRPSFVIIKCATNNISGYASWMIFDSARQTYNYDTPTERLEADTPFNENGDNRTQGIDFLSNGFLLNSTYGDTISGNQTFIYAAFAEMPFKYATAR